MLKVGALPFINALPFFHSFLVQNKEFEGKLEFGTPAKINQLLEEGAVDIGLISSASFLANRDKYVLLSNLGIGTRKKMNTVCLYTKGPVQELSGKVIAIPSANMTSVVLLKVLCSHFWNVSPLFKEYATGSSLAELFGTADAILMVGDECLTAEVPLEYQVTDLGSAWVENTKKPFVFCLFATRCDSWMRLPLEVQMFHRALTAAYEYSQANFDEILGHVGITTGLSAEVLRDHYNLLDYYLDSDHFHGLEYFVRLSKIYDHLPQREAFFHTVSV